MPVYSHSKPINGNEREGSKLLIDHLKGVRDKAISHLSHRSSFGDKENETVLDAICWLHDLGKYTSYFQTYLLKPEKSDHQLKSHSNLGAHTAFKYFERETEKALLAFYLIKMHHSNLMNFDDVICPDREARMRQEWSFPKQKAALSNQEEILKFFDLKNEHIAFNDPKTLYNYFKKEIRKTLTIEHYFKTNYLFSLLIEADKLDASDTEPSTLTAMPENAVDERKGFGKPHYPDKPLKEFSQNELRNFVRSEVIKK
ncbi:MAG: CRISPR-associated endonuclease Cas3'' [Owenweeksia sp.]|nr:CRISPR-associated endonuclease Cas3'' [Owenweeksia sp.]